MRGCLCPESSRGSIPAEGEHRGQCSDERAPPDGEAAATRNAGGGASHQAGELPWATRGPQEKKGLESGTSAAERRGGAEARNNEPGAFHGRRKKRLVGSGSGNQLGEAGRQQA